MPSTSMQPEKMVEFYYTALYGGDLDLLKSLMTKASYMMTLEAFGLRLVLKDRSFKSLLKKSEEDENALKTVEKLLSKELKARDLSPVIKIINIENNGYDRQTVNFTEDGNVKKLHFSYIWNEWKIDYYAGRKRN